MQLTDFDITVLQDDGEVQLQLTGELDLVTAPRLRAALDALTRGAIHRVVIDLGGLTLLGSSGLHVLEDLLSADGGPEVVFVRTDAPAVTTALGASGLANRLRWVEPA